MSAPLITPAQVPQNYKNTIEDLLLEILNKLPVPNGDALTVLNGKFEWITAGGGRPLYLECNGFGALIVGNEAGTWSSTPQGIFNYSALEGSINIILSPRDQINWGPNFLTTQGMDGDFFFNAPVIASAFSTPIWLMQNHIEVLNKAEGSFLRVMQRNISGAEARADLCNIKDVNDDGEYFGFNYEARTLFFNGATALIGTKDSNDLSLMTNNQVRLIFAANGNILPVSDGNGVFGTTTQRFYNAYFSNMVSSVKFSNDAGTTLWSLAARATGTVALDTAHYIPIVINGTTYKLLIST